MNPGSTDYPSQAVEVVPFPADFGKLFPKPAGLMDSIWPPDQVTYLGLYLTKLGCKSIVTESHYIDRDYIWDLSVFYGRSLRCYPNYCRRYHFFARELSAAEWSSLFDPATSEADRKKLWAALQAQYLGFMVVKPLPGSPVGRTVLRSYPPDAKTGTRSFGGTRKYRAHLAGYEFSVDGLAFQQQDQGVSACATTALWTSLHKVAYDERMSLPTPADITEAASRYLLAEGRSLPSEGLNIQQICEAIRGTGLQPVVIRSVSVEEDRAQLVGYVNSGFPPVLAVQSLDGETGHAICVVGTRMGAFKDLVPTSAHPNHLRAADSLQAIYIHDDRLGPYASAELVPWTQQVSGQSRILTALQIQWPDKTQAELSIVKALMVPVPDKIRMPLSRVLASGAVVAELSGLFFKEFDKRIILNVAYKLGARYREEAFSYGLTKDGLTALCCGTVLPRFLAVIEIIGKEEPLFDVLLDTTETRANPSALLFVRRSALKVHHEPALRLLAKQFGAKLIV